MLMKLLILSDVHGNVDALRAIWKEEQDSDKIYCAGDLTDYGAFPEEVIRWMREHHAEVVCGNHDRFVNNKEMNPDRFKWIKHYAELSDNRRKVVLCHYPIMCYNGQYRVDEKGEPKNLYALRACP